MLSEPQVSELPQVIQSNPSHKTPVALIPESSQHQGVSNKHSWQAVQHLLDSSLGRLGDTGHT